MEAPMEVITTLYAPHATVCLGRLNIVSVSMPRVLSFQHATLLCMPVEWATAPP